MPDPQQDWFAKSDADWFASQDAAQPAAPAASSSSWLDLAKEGVGGLVSGVLSPVALLKNIYDDASFQAGEAKAAAERGDILGTVVAGAKATPLGQSVRVARDAGRAQWDQLQKGKKAYDEGRMSEALGHTMAGLLPLLGPMAAHAGEEIGSGDPKRAARAVGEVSSLAVPAAAAKVVPKSVSIGGRFRNTNPAEVAAVEFGQRAGIPIDAATATGNPVVRAGQWMADRSIGGAVVGQRAARAQTEALTRVSGELANRAHPTPVAPETAGTAIRNAVQERIAAHHSQATKAYGELEAIEQANVRPVQVGTKKENQTVREYVEPEVTAFKNPRGSTEELFQEVLADAKRNGFKGSPGRLRREFEKAVSDAKAMAKDASETEVGFGTPTGLLEAIARNGGIGKDTNRLGRTRTSSAGVGMPGEIDQLWENSTGLVVGRGYKKGTSILRSSHKTSGGAIGGVRGVLKHDGKNLEEMVEALGAEGWGHRIPDVDSLLNEIDAARVSLMRSKGDKPLSHWLEGVGVKPGHTWWEGAERPYRDVTTSVDVPVMENIGLPIDLTTTREALRPVYDRLLRESQLVPLMGEKGRALTSLDRLMNGPKVVAASVADGALSELKSLSRFDGLPELRPEGKGVAAQAVRALEDEVQYAVSQGGPKATAARDTGRQATRDKYSAGDVFLELKTEPVRAYRQATLPGDQNIAYLRQLHRVAPKEMGKVGRAFLGDLFDTATAEGGFSRAQGLQKKWQDLGPETKKILFPDAALRSDLDHFFLLAKRMAESPNPSGTALTGWLPAQAGLVIFNPLKGVPMVLGSAALSKLLHSRAGVKALTEAMTVPLRNRAVAAARAARVTAMAGRDAVPLSAVPAMAGEETSPP